MNKTIIKLTESDLHRIVKESVNKILNEIRLQDKSYHGNNSKDWDKLSDIRRDISDYYDKKEKDIANAFLNNRYDLEKYANDRISARRKKAHNYDIAARNMFNALDVDDDFSEKRVNDFINGKRLSSDN